MSVNKKEKMNTEEEVNKSDSEEGITIGLIDAIIAICEVLSARDMFDEKDLIQEALKDLRSNDTMKMLMDIGELQDAKDYIQEQKKIINLLCSSSELLKRIGSTDRQQSQSADVAERKGDKDEWISVTEKLPPTANNKFNESEVVAVYNESLLESATAWYNSESKQWFIYHHIAPSVPIPVTHWMPLNFPPSKP